MKQQTSKKSFFQWAPTIFFLSLLIVGGMSVTDIQAEILDGTGSGVEYCEDQDLLNAVGEKAKVKKVPINLDITKTLNNPLFTGTLNVPKTAPDPSLAFAGDGVALSKNNKSGVFSFTGIDGNLSITLIGKYSLDKAKLNVAKVSGNFIVQDPDFPCITSGKFKAKLR